METEKELYDRMIALTKELSIVIHDWLDTMPDDEEKAKKWVGVLSGLVGKITEDSNLEVYDHIVALTRKSKIKLGRY